MNNVKLEKQFHLVDKAAGYALCVSAWVEVEMGKKEEDIALHSNFPYIPASIKIFHIKIAKNLKRI